MVNRGMYSGKPSLWPYLWPLFIQHQLCNRKSPAVDRMSLIKAVVVRVLELCIWVRAPVPLHMEVQCIAVGKFNLGENHALMQPSTIVLHYQADDLLW